MGIFYFSSILNFEYPRTHNSIWNYGGFSSNIQQRCNLLKVYNHGNKAIANKFDSDGIYATGDSSKVVSDHLIDIDPCDYSATNVVSPNNNIVCIVYYCDYTNIAYLYTTSSQPFVVGYRSTFFFN